MLYRWRRPLVWSVLVVVISLVASVQVQAHVSDNVWKLNPPLVTEGTVFDFRISNDGSRVVYIANQDDPQQYELYSVPITGGVAVKLNIALDADTFIMQHELSPDGSHVLYIVRDSMNRLKALYSVPITGGPSTLLSTDLTDSETIGYFVISPDSSRVVYTKSLFPAGTFKSSIYSVPLEGGTSTKLSIDLSGEQDTGYFQISPDSQYVVYVLSQGSSSSEPDALYSVPLVGGTSVLLDTPFAGYSSYRVTPDSSRVVYTRTQQAPDPATLYSVPIAGGMPVQLNAPANVDVNINSFAISSDSTYVVFSSYSPINDPADLYSTRVDGSGMAVQLNQRTTPDENVTAFKLSPDATRVVYVLSNGPSTQEELYSVPIAGGTGVKLNGPLDPDGTGVERIFYISPNSAYVVYFADQHAGDGSSLPQLYSVPISGSSPAVKINGPLIPSGFISMYDVMFTPDSQYVLYRAEGTTSNLYDLFRTSITGADAVKLNADIPMVAGPPVSIDFGSYLISPDGKYVVFRGSQTRGGQRELYATTIQQAGTATHSIYLPLVVR